MSLRLVYFGNNQLAVRCLQALGTEGRELVALVLHPPERRRHGDELVRLTGLPDERVFDASTLTEPETLQRLAALGADLGLSVLFGYRLGRELLELFPRGVLNLHPGLLPYNRGSYPNVWSIVDGTPAGVTLHWMDEGLDTGDIAAQREVAVEPTDTGESLYHRLEDAAVELLVREWPAMLAGTATRTAQPEGGTCHRVADVEAIDHIDPERRYRAGELIDILRARTFPPHPGAYFVDGGRRIYLRLELLAGEPPGGQLREDRESPWGEEE